MYSTEQRQARVDPAHGCALGGVIAFCNSIAGALPLVHGSAGCASGYRLVMLLCDREPLMPTTGVSQLELALGSGDKLDRALRKAWEHYHPPILFVVLTCATSMTGEDHTARLRAFERETGCKTFLVDGSAIFGEDSDGYLESYRQFTRWLDVRRRPDGAHLALDGFSPDLFGAKDAFGQLKSLVEEECGLRAAPSVSVAFRPEDAGEYACAALLHVGRLWTLDEPRCLAPIGVEACHAFVRRACQAAGKPVPSHAQAHYAAARTRFDQEKAALLPRLAEKDAMVEADGFFAVPLARLLKEEFGMRVSVSTDSSGYEMLAGEGICHRLMADVGGYELDHACREVDCVLAFGSSNVNTPGRWAYVPYTSPCWDDTNEHITYFGYPGAFALLDRLKELLL